MIATHDQCPNELMQADSVRYPASSDVPELLLNIALCLLQQPHSQVAVNLDRCQLQVFWRNVAEIKRPFRFPYPFRQSLRQFFGMPFDQAHQIRYHHLRSFLTSLYRADADHRQDLRPTPRYESVQQLIKYRTTILL